ncbi:MAG: hypothetical protein F6J86_12160 [Symploca sp. SIO1B1]|nr:hypothetical protein [Symploca sp. SIO1B1]
MNIKSRGVNGKKLNERVGFAIGTGRCGTHFIAKVIDLEPNIACVHERNPLNETFHRYCKWYGLPIDHEGFLQTKAFEIEQDLKNHSFSFESSAYLSLSIQELYTRFDAKFIFLVRSPEKVVNSYLRKGWYKQPIFRVDLSLPPSYQNGLEFRHFLGRIIPSSTKFQLWCRMSRVGKLAWYWNMLNAKVLEQFQTLPATHWRLEKLEELSYWRYQEVAQFLGFQTQVPQEKYEILAQRRPGAQTNVPTIESWTESEIAEFETEVAPMAKKLGYEYRISCLLS